MVLDPFGKPLNKIQLGKNIQVTSPLQFLLNRKMKKMEG